jgi:hypothetical protein
MKLFLPTSRRMDSDEAQSSEEVAQVGCVFIVNVYIHMM